MGGPRWSSTARRSTRSTRSGPTSRRIRGTISVDGSRASGGGCGGRRHRRLGPLRGRHAGADRHRRLDVPRLPSGRGCDGTRTGHAGHRRRRPGEAARALGRAHGVPPGVTRAQRGPDGAVEQRRRQRTDAGARTSIASPSPSRASCRSGRSTRTGWGRASARRASPQRSCPAGCPTSPGAPTSCSKRGCRRRRRSRSPGSADALSARRSWRCELPDGIVQIPCGGTHLRSLAELAAVQVDLECSEVEGAVELRMRTTATPRT